jgi:sugar diacid utilization regulator
MNELLDFQNKLLKELVSGGGLRELVQQISTFLRRDVLIINPTHRILASTLANSDLSEGRLLKIAMTVPIQERTTAFLGGKEVEVLVSELNNSKKRLGFLLIYEPGLDEDSQIKNVALQARATCSIELQKQEELLEQSRQYKEAFLFDLLYGNMEDPADIITRGKVWGWDLHLSHVAAVFELEDFEFYSSDLQLLKILCEIVQTVTESLDQTAIVFQKNEEVILILPVENKNSHEKKAYFNMIIQKIKALSEEHLPSRIVRVGVGKEYTNPTEIFRSYQEAKVASKLGSLLQERSHTPFFIDLGIERIIYNHDRQELEEFYKETLEPLVEYDKSQKNELMETLEKFLVNRCEMKETAEALFLHPNTLRYRLKRIEEVLEIDIKDFDTVLSLMVAFKIKHLKKFS